MSEIVLSEEVSRTTNPDGSVTAKTVRVVELSDGSRETRTAITTEGLRQGAQSARSVDAPRCDACHSPITHGAAVKVEGETRHEVPHLAFLFGNFTTTQKECVRCAFCAVALGENIFKNAGGKLCCAGCAGKRAAE